ncbi:MAG: mannose-1-phosphate guanylyltransferase [Chloroflexi bacterium]|nr:mannose-1-phosphate guanylyltransferase [Chloroflexota bacterium]
MGNPLYAVILAGGVGTRLWPLSRSRLPKQLLPLVRRNTTMLQITLERILPLIPADQVFVLTNESYVPLVQEQLPQLSPENVFGEPAGRGTAPAIAAGALLVQQRNPQGIMFSLHADHHIEDEPAFRQVLQAAADVAAENYLVTLGITPTGPETGYGYIKQGPVIGTYRQITAYRIAQFIEKPDLETATAFLAEQIYLWNSGIFTWRVDQIIQEMERLLPELMAPMHRMASALGTPDQNRMVAEVWPELPNVTIDRGVMEHTDRAAMVPANVGWNDVGSWEAVYHLISQNGEQNAVMGDHLSVETKGTLIYGDNRIIATVGVQDLVIVDTQDALLICARDRAQDVKRIVEQLKAANRQEYL